MNTRRLRNSLSMMTTGLVLMNTAWAGSPVWTFAPVSGYPASVSVSPSGTATIKYTVTNQSHKSHTLKMRPIQGISSSGCTSLLGYHQSCTLTLDVAGSGLKGDVIGGPVLCDQSNPNQCYQPSQANSLAIRLTQTPPVQQYTVTSSADSNGSISPMGSQTVNSGTSLSFAATPNAGYGVNQWLVDSSLVQTGGTTYQLTNITANHTVQVTFGTVTLTPSVATLGLSANCTTASATCITKKNDALTGNPREITIQNNGSVRASNVTVATSSLPTGTTVSSNTCNGTLDAGASCVITLTPGDTVSSNCTTGTAPMASTVTITADGGLSTSVDVYVLSYGCQYQDGYIYSVDDAYATAPIAGSIGGKVAALTDSVPGQTISSPGVPNWGGYGCDIGTSLWSNAIQGANDGSANSAAIVSALTTNFSVSPCYLILGLPVALPNYAAGRCSQYTTPSDAGQTWYVPSICELSGTSPSSNCNAGTTSMLNELWLLNPAVGGFVDTGLYWSSTEYADSSTAGLHAWSPQFSAGGILFFSSKNIRRGVRCSRALTI